MIKKSTKIILSFVLMIVLLYFLIKNINLTEIKVLYNNFNGVYLLLAIPLYLLTYFLRTNRFHLLLNKKIGYLNLFGIVSIHNFLINILPARLGELGYIKMIHKKGIILSKNIKSLVIVRFIDLIIILLFFLIFFKFSNLQLDKNLFYLAFLLLIFLIIILIFNKFFFLLLKRINKILFNKKLNKIGSKIELFIESLRNEIKLTNKSILIKIFLLGTLIWLLGFLFNYVLLIGLGINISLLWVFMLVSILLFVTIIPIYPPGGFGAIEGVWALGLVFYGIQKETAIIAGFYLHGVQLILTILMGILGLFIIKRIKK